MSSIPAIKPSLTSESLCEDLRKTLIDSTIYVLKAQAGVDVTLGEVKPYGDKGPKEPVSVAAAIGIVGDLVKGGAALAFPAATFLGLANHMLGEVYKEVTPENQDLCGELLNMIFGAVKTQFTDVRKIPFHRAIPVVMRGANLNFSIDAKAPTYWIEFKSSLGIFYAVAAISLMPASKT
jgi:CheY-specific phosphatase CheX